MNAVSLYGLLRAMFRRSPPGTKCVPPNEIRPGTRILCHDRKSRPVEVVEHMGAGSFRFSFSDGTWAEYRPGQRVTVLV